MSKDRKVGYRHLISRIPNTEDNRNIVKEINKMMSKSDSLSRIYVKYRQPTDGHKYDFGGGLKREHAKSFSIYLKPAGNMISTEHEFYRDLYLKGKEKAEAYDSIREVMQWIK
tara:strand:- start:14 stop:352 length:339 start_codon:yes stop_codon:yes gene_type:complete